MTSPNIEYYQGDVTLHSNSHYETDFGVSIACGDGNTKIGFLKARLRRAFKKPIFIMRIAEPFINIREVLINIWKSHQKLKYTNLISLVMNR